MVINLKRLSVRLSQVLTVAGVVIFSGSSVVGAQTVSPLMTSTPPSSEMGITVAPHAKTIDVLVPEIRTQLASDYKYLKPFTPDHAGFLYKVIGYNFYTLADTRYESSVVNASFTIKGHMSAQKGAEAAAAAGVVLKANDFTVPMPARVQVKNTTYYERDDSVVVVKVEDGKLSITADTRRGLWTSAAMTTSFVQQLIDGTQNIQNVKGDKTSNWWQKDARQGKTLTFSRPVFYGVASHQEADMFIGTNGNGRNYHFVQQDGQWKLAGNHHDKSHWRKR